jgi:demethylmenaquinone methyltransferase/2-methoxy-6-polyprenyl-1,4-benzoquinol methylase
LRTRAWFEVVYLAYYRENIRVSKSADLNKEPEEVASMFDGVAKRYDIMNDLLSLGQTKAWRKKATAIIAPHAGMKILDIAAGTGSSSRPLADAGADVIPADFSQGMLDAGKKRHPDLPFTLADALNLPFLANEFDVTTISFGLRNTNDVDQALREALRVTKPGGRLVVVEFSHPTNALFRKIYMKYLMSALPKVARKLSSNPDAYIYLAQSIQAWPAQEQLAEKISLAGWETVAWQNFTFGIVAVHIAFKAAQ